MSETKIKKITEYGVQDQIDGLISENAEQITVTPLLSFASEMFIFKYKNIVIGKIVFGNTTGAEIPDNTALASGFPRPMGNNQNRWIFMSSNNTGQTITGFGVANGKLYNYLPIKANEWRSATVCYVCE